MSNLEEEEMENHQQTEEIEEAEGNEEINEKENEDNDQILNNTIIESLITRTKKLQEENAQLKQDIENISTSNKGNALQYFTNIRKEIFTKIDTLNKQIQDFNKNKIIENKKQKRDMEYINGQLNEATELNKNLKAQLENITRLLSSDISCLILTRLEHRWVYIIFLKKISNSSGKIFSPSELMMTSFIRPFK